MDLNFDTSQIMSSANPNCSHFLLLYHLIIVCATMVITIEMKKTRYNTLLFHLQEHKKDINVQRPNVNMYKWICALSYFFHTYNCIQEEYIFYIIGIINSQ